MREAHQSLGRWDLALTPWGKAAEFHEICQIWNNHVTPLMKLSQMGLTTQTVCARAKRNNENFGGHLQFSRKDPGYMHHPWH